MREGWTYKKLGEVATIIGGSTPKSNIEEYWGGSHYWVTPADLKGNKYQGATPRTITNLAIQKTNLQLLPTGTVLLSSRAPIGKVAITTVPMYCNQGFKNVVCSEQLLNEFVYWYLLNKTEYLNSLGRGATFKEISKKATEQIPIPVPPISEQQRIVNELDLLSSIIDKKKAQLKEYDQLAQSIFYDMFGDPVSNEKGWEVKKLGEVGTIVTGNTPSTKDNRNYDSNDVCFFKPSDIEKDGISLLSESEFYVSSFAYNSARKLPKGSVLVTCIGIVGKVGILEIEATCNQQINAIVPNNQVNSNYVAFSILAKRRIIESIAHAPVVPIINKGTFSQLSIPLPPLPLQQSFASKIEAIKRQKALIRQSITEVETLFNSRMDYWFS
jgi:type I restriction enzyme S subunit